MSFSIKSKAVTSTDRNGPAVQGSVQDRSLDEKNRLVQGTFCPVASIAMIILCVAMVGIPKTSKARERPMEDRLTLQNKLFAGHYGEERAAASGNDGLAAYSISSIQRSNRSDRRYRDQIAAISTSGFPAQDRLSHEIFVYAMNRRIESYNFKNFEMPLSQRDGIHSRLANLPASLTFKSYGDYRKYLGRLQRIPEHLKVATRILRQGMQDRLMPPSVLLTDVPAQCDVQRTKDSFLEPLSHIPSAVNSKKKLILNRKSRAP